MTARGPHLVWNVSPELLLVAGFIFLISWAPSLYDRIRLAAGGVTTSGTIRSVTKSYSRGIDEIRVMYDDGAGHRVGGIIYGGAHEYLDGQNIVLKQLPTDSSVVQIAPGERGDLLRAEVLNTVIGSVLAGVGAIWLTLKWRQRWRLFQQGGL